MCIALLDQKIWGYKEMYFSVLLYGRWHKNRPSKSQIDKLEGADGAVFSGEGASKSPDEIIDEGGDF